MNNGMNMTAMEIRFIPNTETAMKNGMNILSGKTVL